MRRHDRSVAIDAIAGLTLLTLSLGGASVYAALREASESGIDRHALQYSSLVDALGRLDPDSVDGPPLAGRHTLSLGEVSNNARALAAHLRAAHQARSRDRATVLATQLDAVALRADQLDGRTLSLVEELHWLLGVDRLPRRGPPFHELHARLEQLLPGREPLSRRLEAYQRRFIVARGRLNGVVMRALAACRAKTVRHLELPPGESVGVEYVADRPWSGYSVYHGDFRSTIQINRVFSFSVDQILTLACHEGYPGHHVYNVLRDRDIVRGRQWPEASVLPVFSPAGFRAETLATAAGALAFSPAERIALFRRELFPAAGLTPAQAERYVHVGSIVDALAGEIAAVIVTYLQGTIGRDEAARSLRERALMEHPEPLLAFVDRYRAYALAYTIGREWLQPDPDGSTEIWSNLTRLIVPEQGTPR